MKRVKGRVAAALLMLLAALVAIPAAAQTFPERGRAAVVDAANVIPDKQEQALAAQLTAWQRETGHQFVVATVPDLQGYTIAQYANGLFRHWRLGGANAHDGVLLLHAPTERRIRIEVGYGLEGTITDLVASRIRREAIIPTLDRDPGGALTAGAEEIMEAAGGVPAQAASATTATPARFAATPPAPAEDGPSIFRVLFLSFLPAMLIVVLLVWLFRRGRKPLPDGPVRPLSKRAQRRREQRAAAIAAGSVTWDGGTAYAWQQSSSDSSSSSWSSSDSSWSSSNSSWSSSDSGGFDSGGGSSGGGGSDSSY